MRGTVQCEPPNKNIETFEGNIALSGSEPISLSMINMLLRGTQLRNTEWVTGVVVYTGKETKIQMNVAATPHKWSSIMATSNKQTVLMFFLMLTLCVFAGAMSIVNA